MTEYVIIRTVAKPYHFYREINGVGRLDERLEMRATRIPAAAATAMLANELQGQGQGLTAVHVRR